jgi:hypothetical protein
MFNQCKWFFNAILFILLKESTQYQDQFSNCNYEILTRSEVFHAVTEEAV